MSGHKFFRVEKYGTLVLVVTKEGRAKKGASNWLKMGYVVVEGVVIDELSTFFSVLNLQWFYESS